MGIDERRISICITTYNRGDMTVNSFQRVLNDPRISEIVIIDDCSNSDEWNKLCNNIGALNNFKIKLHRNEQNLGCFRNKREAISKAENEFVVILDSDNSMDVDYIDHVYAYGFWGKNVVYAPDFAKPKFDYTAFASKAITKKNVRHFVNQTNFDALINTMNYFVNRDEYIRVWNDNEEPHAIDSFYQNVQWLEAGNIILVVKGLQYEHSVHRGSLYMEIGHKTGQLFKILKNKLKAMK